jgi:hypothetical protein
MDFVMHNHSTITIHGITQDGKHEGTKLRLRTVAEARQVAQRVLRIGRSLYTQVAICDDEGTIETIHDRSRERDVNHHG